MEPATARGSCLCGVIGFVARLPSKWVVHCHCTRCQRAHGAAFVTWVGLEAASVDIADPQSALSWYVTADEAGRGFCSRCGSPMFFRSPRYPGELHVARALFATPLDREPGEHVYHATHVHWVVLADALPRSAGA